MHQLVPIEILQRIGWYLLPNDYKSFRSCFEILPLQQQTKASIIFTANFLEGANLQDLFYLETYHVSTKIFLFFFEHDCFDWIRQTINLGAKGIDLNAQDGFAILKAFEMNQMDIFEWLLPRIHTDVLNHIWIQSCLNGHIDIVNVLIKDHRIDVFLEDNRALVGALTRKHLNVVEVLLRDKRTNTSSQENQAFKLAVFYGYDRIVELLLKDSRIMPNCGNNEPILNASEFGYTFIVSLLLNNNLVDPTVQKYRAIRMAFANRHFEVVEMLLLDKRINLQKLLEYLRRIPVAQNAKFLKWLEDRN
jgi:ankyrin repeat protein